MRAGWKDGGLERPSVGGMRVGFGRQWREQLVSRGGEKMGLEGTSRGWGKGPAEPHKGLASGGRGKREAVAFVTDAHVGKGPQ